MGTKSYDAGGCDSFVDVNAQWAMSSLEPPAWRGGCWSRGEWGSVNWIINASTARLITTVSSVSQPGPNRKETDNNRPAGMCHVPIAAHSLHHPGTDWPADASYTTLPVTQTADMSTYSSLTEHRCYPFQPHSFHRITNYEQDLPNSQQ